MKLKKASSITKSILAEVGKIIVGKEEVLERVLIGILAKGNLLLEDVPGLAKTMMIKAFAQVMKCDFTRVQCTPDLLPADVTGSTIYNQKELEFSFRKGPVFTNLLLVDEINRASPKTQSALLEAMQEQHVTVDGVTYPLPQPFHVLATQNPIEFEGTFPLPEAQLDRFIMRIGVGYPDKGDEIEILNRRITRKREEFELESITDEGEILEIQQVVEEIHIDDRIKEYIVEIVQRTRDNDRIEVGASPRGSLALLHLARASAVINGRDFANPDDVKKVVIPALSHRIILSTGSWLTGINPADVLARELTRIKAPRLD
ncbi:MAG: AAA family ATPase [Candidatus Heimdallarchaeota archaeon]|nr:MoxR family ATPase [Candidatus Heimdallarchaeota archaeon]MCG3253418.1 MoxR family ATPase [Candidatus Heimdallarchaeota archaeon]MCK4290555.1 MoxR family ATPase [Candidatus Heimdallarchaeota archaeon]